MPRTPGRTPGCTPEAKTPYNQGIPHRYDRSEGVPPSLKNQSPTVAAIAPEQPKPVRVIPAPGVFA